MKNSFLNFDSLSLCYRLIALMTLFIGTNQATAQPNPFNTSRSLQTDFSNNSALPADSAFRLSALVELPDTIVLMWEIEEGYYLYRKSLNIEVLPQQRTITMQLPEAEHISDEFFGEVEIYRNKLITKFPYLINTNDKSGSLQLELSYQGCAEIGYCYPMQLKVIELALP